MSKLSKIWLCIILLTISSLSHAERNTMQKLGYCYGFVYFGMTQYKIQYSDFTDPAKRIMKNYNPFFIGIKDKLLKCDKVSTKQSIRKNCENKLLSKDEKDFLNSLPFIPNSSEGIVNNADEACRGLD